MDKEKIEPEAELVLADSGLEKPESTVVKEEDQETADKAKIRAERTATFQDYVRVFSYATKWDFLAYAAGVFASIGAGVTLPLMNVLFGNFVGNFSSFTVSSGTGESQASFESKVDQLALYMFALFIARLGLNYINKFAFRMIGIRLSSAIRLHYLQRLFAQSIHVLDSMPPGYATDTITSTSNTLQLGISEKLGVFVEYSSTMIAAIIIAFTRSWELTLVTSTIILFIAFTVAILVPLIVKGHGRMTKAEGKSSSIASEAMASIRMIVACGAETRIAQRYDVYVDEAKKHAQFISPLIAAQFGLVFFGAFGAFGLAFWFGTQLYLEDKLNGVGTILIVLFSVLMVVFSLERTSTPLLAVSKATVAACQFFIVIDAPQPEKGHLQEADISPTEDIVLENVTFAYPSRPHVKILDDLSLNIEAGKITAIVGPSGSGKSTIVGLIEQWYTLKDQHVLAKAIENKKKKKKKDGEDDSEEENNSGNPALKETDEGGPPILLSGKISISGHSLNEVDLKWWRSQIGLVQQEPFLFNETIYINVAYGLVGSKWENDSEETKRERVKQACMEAFADEFIDKLPDGYDTLVGDSGARLSGGQRQRIAIARSIVHQPKILILDEATSSLDVRGERKVQVALDRVAQNRTTITIAHRLSTIKKADRIVVLKKGKVVEQGTHDSLIANEGGVYATLVNAQALSLGEPAEASDESVEAEDDDQSLMREKSHAKSEAVDKPKSKKTRQRGLFASFGRFFYESKSQWYLMIITLIFNACAAAGSVLQSWLFAQVVFVFKYTGSKLNSESEFWGKMWAVLATGIGLSYFGGFFASTRLATIVRAKYQKQYFESILFQKTSFFDEEDHSQGTMTSRAASDPRQLEELMGANMASVCISIFTIIGAVAIAFSFGWKLSFVGIGVVMPLILGSSYWRFKYELSFEKMNNEVFAESSKFASESIAAFRTVTSLTLEEFICQRFEKLCREHTIKAYKKARWVSLLFAFSDSATLPCQALLFFYGSRLLASGEYGIINYLVIMMATMQGAESAGQGLSFGPNAAQASAAANRMLDMRESRMNDEVNDGQKIPDSEGGMKIELRNLHFKYPTRDVPVFKGLNLTIEKGQFAALVGASGCGKTSIISLLERFYDLDGGQILCNDVDICGLQYHAYRRQLSLVAQEATLLQGTIRDNVLLGVDPSSVTEEQLHQACRDASIHDFVISLPEGYNTNIGSRGVSLSGGQKQRVAIARALIREPNLLLLDEATSSLDSQSEALVQAAFERAGKGRTMLVVAHRLATVQNADVIFVLGEGKLLEKGNHTELLKKRGVYWQMCQSQALDR